MTAATFLDVGGVPPLALAEDHALWAPSRPPAGASSPRRPCPWSRAARGEARAADGFGAFLRRLEASPAR